MATPFKEPAFKPTATGFKAWSTTKKVLIIGGVILIIALGVGLGVGLGLGLNKGEDKEEPGERPPIDHPPSADWKGWQPKVNTTWQIELRYPLKDTSYDAEVYDIDLYDNPKSMIKELQGMGRKVICYFSAGTMENWRDDKDEFEKEDLGNTLEDWPNERWVDQNSENVREIMAKRLDLAREKGCDGVDPDNIDAYDNDNGLGLTEEDATDYVTFFAGQAQARNLSIGLKNAGAIIPKVLPYMQWSVNEECAEYDECDVYDAFTEAGKPVFHIEYPKGQDTNNNNTLSAKKIAYACDAPGTRNFSTIIKNMVLDDWFQLCNGKTSVQLDKE